MITVSVLAGHVGGVVVGDGELVITGLASAEGASQGELTFAEKPSYLAEAERSQASAILVSNSVESSSKVLIRVKDPRVAIAKILPLFFPLEEFPAGIHATAVVDGEVHPTAHVGPHCVVAGGVQIGEGSVLMGGNHIGLDSRIGRDVRLHPNVVLYPKSQIGDRVEIHAGTTIGSDGYGYVFDDGRHLKMQQVGYVVIEDDVEIGANTAIDRGALGATRIGQGTKIDNLVHVAHNVVMGKHCLIMGQVGFAGSTHLSDHVIIASQSGIAGHLKIGAQAMIGAKSGVMRDIEAGAAMLGSPAAPDKQTKRQWIAAAQLPGALKRLKALEKRVCGS
jgi:UDP-3-O-[3-hydroxymyristoyl] glucosamine N-acyltransferase